jgi:hypothetical protein
MPNFRQQYKKQKEDLLRRHEESVADKGGGQFGSYVDIGKLPKGVGFWKCAEGSHTIDFIPFIAGPDMPQVSGGGIKENSFTWLVDLWVHRNIGVLENPYVCPARTNGDPCPICEHLQQNRDSYEKKDYDALKAKRRTIYLVWCHDNSEEKTKGIQLWDVAHWFMENNLKEIAERPRGGGTVTYFDPDNGKNVVFTKRGSGMSNTQFLGHRFDDREAAIPDNILDQSFALDSVIKYSSYDEIHKAFYGSNTDETEATPVDTTSNAPFVDDQPVAAEPEPAQEPEVASDECPVHGEFGADHDALEACPDCVNWDDCYAANQEMQPDPEPEPEPVPEPKKPALRTPRKTDAKSKPQPIRKPPRRR